MAQLPENPVVSYSTAGIVSQATQAAIDRVKRYEYQQCNISGASAYWYLLQTRNIKANVTDTVAIDIDSGAINYQACGSKGAIGDRGATGRNGIPGPTEDTYYPIITQSGAVFRIPVQTPLTTPISIRLDDGETTEIIYGLDGTSNRTIDGAITYNNGILELTMFSGWEGIKSAKARQIGPTGDPGPDGAAFLRIVESSLPVVSSTSVVSTINNIGNDIYYSVDYPGDYIITSIRPSGLDIIYVVTGSDSFAAIEPDYSLCRWRLGLSSSSSEQIQLPRWGPSSVIVAGDDSVCCQEDLFICNTDLSRYSSSSSSPSSVSSPIPRAMVVSQNLPDSVIVAISGCEGDCIAFNGVREFNYTDIGILACDCERLAGTILYDNGAWTMTLAGDGGTIQFTVAGMLNSIPTTGWMLTIYDYNGLRCPGTPTMAIEPVD